MQTTFDSTSELSLSVYIDKIFPVALLSDPCMLTASVTGCDYSWKPAQKKKKNQAYLIRSRITHPEGLKIMVNLVFLMIYKTIMHFYFLRHLQRSKETLGTLC